MSGKATYPPHEHCNSICKQRQGTLGTASRLGMHTHYPNARSNNLKPYGTPLPIDRNKHCTQRRKMISAALTQGPRFLTSQLVSLLFPCPTHPGHSQTAAQCKALGMLRCSGLEEAA